MLDQVATPQAAVSHDCDAAALAHVPQLLVLELWMHLNLPGTGIRRGSSKDMGYCRISARLCVTVSWRMLMEMLV